MADPVDGVTGGSSAGGVETVTQTPAAAAQSPAPGSASQTSPSPSPSGAASGTTPGTQVPAAPEYTSVRDALAQTYGLDLRQQFQDDHGLLAHLALAYQQNQRGQQLSQYGQLYLQHADQFQAYLRQQQQAQQQQTQTQSWWKAPEYDPSWLSKLTRNPQTGQLEALPGNDPSLVQKYLAWDDHRKGFLEKFAGDPISAIKPGIEQVARQVAEQIIQQQLGSYQATSEAQTFIQQNTSWLHQRDQQGQVLLGPNGAPALSPAGQQFAGYVNEASQLGLRTVESQQRYAKDKLELQLLRAQAQQQPGNAGVQQQQAAANQQFVNQAAQNRGTQAPTPPANTNGQPSPITTRSGLEQAMMAAMQQNGYGPGHRLF